MSLDMGGMVDAVFQSVPATRTVVTPGTYVNGIAVPGSIMNTSYTVNIQSASDREIDFLSEGGERVLDMRRVYVNDGDIQPIDNSGEWVFLGQRWKPLRCDNRYWRNYCKLIVVRLDVQ